jgi:predicted P-loop ATPase
MSLEYSYSPKELVYLANGISLSGFADDGMIEIVPEEEMKYTTSVGADGRVMRSESSNNNYIATLTFQQGSLSAKMLFALNAVFPFTVQDPASKDEVVVSTQSYVINRPTMKRGKEAHMDNKVQIMLVDPSIVNLI